VRRSPWVRLVLFLFVFPLATSGQEPRGKDGSDDRPAGTVPADDLIWRAERACGVNCAYLLLRYHDQAVVYRALEADLVRDDLASLADLKRATSSRGLATQVLRADRRGLEALSKPLVAHLDKVSPRGETSGHFVLVLKTDSEDGVDCIDGTTAEPQTIPWSDFSRDWSGHVLAIATRSPLSHGLRVAACGVAMLLGYQLVRHRRSLLAIVQRAAGWAGSRIQPATAAAVGLLVLPGPIAQAGDIPTLEAIGRVYQERERGIQTIRADYHLEQTPLLSREAYYKATHNHEAVPSDFSTVIASDGRRYYSSNRRAHHLTDLLIAIKKRQGGVEPDANNVAFSDLTAAMSTVAARPDKDLMVFDGVRFWQSGGDPLAANGIERVGYSIAYIPRLEGAYFSSTPLDMAFWPFPMPAMPKDDEQIRKHRIPDKFAIDPFTVSPTPDRVGDDDCVVLVAPDKEKLWLMTSKGFALCKAEYRFEGQKVLDAEFGDWRQIPNGAWIAGKTTTTSFAVKNYYPADFEGKPLHRVTYILTKLAVNDPSSEALLRVEPKPGELVVDENLVTGPAKGVMKPMPGGGATTEAVNYIIPAEGADLDRVVKAAVAEDRARNPPAWYQSPAAWIGAVVLVVVVVVAVRASRKK